MVDRIDVADEKQKDEIVAEPKMPTRSVNVTCQVSS